MQQAGAVVAGETAEPVDDFTEDLLDALAADDSPLSAMDTQPIFVKSTNPEETLDPRAAFTHEQTVEAVREKYRLHASDTGSSQVQVAVLTARIQYMTSHMQKNKKDYSSLRGLTAMVPHGVDSHARPRHVLRLKFPPRADGRGEGPRFHGPPSRTLGSPISPRALAAPNPPRALAAPHAHRS